MANIGFKINGSENQDTKEQLKTMPDKVIRLVAQEVLDRSYSLIPKDTKQMALSSKSKGVTGANGNYYIGSYTKYAHSVWNMDPETTNWTEPGTTSKWYLVGWKKYRTAIMTDAVNREGIK